MSREYILEQLRSGRITQEQCRSMLRRNRDVSLVAIINGVSSLGVGPHQCSGLFGGWVHVDVDSSEVNVKWTSHKDGHHIVWGRHRAMRFTCSNGDIEVFIQGRSQSPVACEVLRLAVIRFLAKKLIRAVEWKRSRLL